MTREEAIGWLKVINTKEFAWDEFALQESQREIRERCEDCVREAIDMAIEALSAEETIEIKPTKVKGDFRIDDIDKNKRSIFEDIVWVVRCRDCRHAYFKDFDKYCPYMVSALKPDGYCSHGERKE